MTDLADAPALPRQDVEALADTMVDLVRTFNRSRQHWLATAEHDVEWSALAVLKYLHNDGPARAGAIADHLQFDASTVSRLVAALVKDGLLERRADPEDGRASILVLTPDADAALAKHQAARVTYFAEMLAGWTPDEVSTFATALGRFTESYERTMSERTASVAARAGSTD
jgi:DNA-binding MarR family transcriptional regulator